MFQSYFVKFFQYLLNENIKSFAIKELKYVKCQRKTTTSDVYDRTKKNSQMLKTILNDDSNQQDYLQLLRTTITHIGMTDYFSLMKIRYKWFFLRKLSSFFEADAVRTSKISIS